MRDQDVVPDWKGWDGYFLCEQTKHILKAIFCSSIKAAKVTCGRAVCWNPILIHVDACDKHADNFAGWLTAPCAFLDSSALVWSHSWSHPVTVCSCLRTRRTPRKKAGRQRVAPPMDTMWAAAPLLYLLGHVYMIYQHCGNIFKKSSDSDQSDSATFHLPKSINSWPWFASLPLKWRG